MSTNAQIVPRVRGKSPVAPIVVLLAGWLVPGAGHYLIGRWGRGVLLTISIVAMFAIGLGLQGKVYVPNTAELLDILNFVGDLGSGCLYFAARAMDLGAPTVLTVVGDYGSKFIVVAGLLNFICAVDAHSLATGRKRA